MSTNRPFRVIALAITLLLSSSLAPSLRAGSTDKNAPDTSKDGDKKTSAPAAGAPTTDTPGSAVETELQEMRAQLSAQIALLEAQQKRIAALEAEIHAGGKPGTPAAENAATPEAEAVRALASGQEQLNQKVIAMQNQMSTTAQSFEERLKNFGPFSF